MKHMIEKEPVIKIFKKCYDFFDENCTHLNHEGAKYLFRTIIKKIDELPTIDIDEDGDSKC